ncbi:pentapeptide repeat protein [Saccharothrix variisporea]|uniref:Pentapeptide repeat protein n=2 Tax=Saccharothrix variisporea TaxID=543527 RepID=A0A495X7Y4_9PSEU|nr:pentapeptide repeat protein [Saccharothrix variisporea]
MSLLPVHVVLAVLIGVAITVGSAFAMWWWLLGHPPLTPGVPSDFNAENRYRLLTIALTVTGGVGGVTALVIAYRKQRLGEADHAREDARLFNERYARVAEQLGSDKAAVRLAGVYAMADLADDWATRRQVCIDVFCGYLRLPYRPPGGDESDEDRAAQEERQVRHTAIRLIRDHLRPGAVVGWNGHDFDFTSAVFDGGDFSGAVFDGGTVSFRSARFVGDVSFRDVVFAEGVQVSFDDAVFDGANVPFTGAAFAGGQVSFRAADFRSGTVDFSKPAQWRLPPVLDLEKAGSAVLPNFDQLVRAVLNHPSVVQVDTATPGKRAVAIRKAHAIPEHEQLIGYLGQVAFTDRRIHVSRGFTIPYTETGSVRFTWHTETVGGGNDQGPTSSDITYVHIHYGVHEERLYEHDSALVDLVRAISRLPGVPAQPLPRPGPPAPRA